MLWIKSNKKLLRSLITTAEIVRKKLENLGISSQAGLAVTGGYTGELHNSNIRVTDEQLAYVEPAKIFALMAYRLLKNGAAEAKKTMAGFKPTMDKEEYFRFMEEMNRKEIYPGKTE